MHQLFEQLLNIFFPPWCCHCGASGKILCANCYAEIDFYACPIRLNIKTTVIEYVYVLGAYSGVLRSLVRSLKYQHIKNIGRELAEIIHYTLLLPDIDCVVPIPIHSSRKQERGFNQTALIAQNLSKKLQRPSYPLLIKTSATNSQTSVADRTAQLNRIQNSFQINPSWQFPTPKRVLLVDDVCTTGTTLTAAAVVLYGAGVKSIFGLAVAHGQ